MRIEPRGEHWIAGLICLPFILNGWFMALWDLFFPSRSVLAWWINIFVKWFVIPMVLMWILHRTTHIKPEQYGLSAKFGIGDVVVLSALPAISIFFLVTLVTFVCTQLIGYSSPYVKSHVNWSVVLEPLGELKIIGVIFLSAAAGVWESLFFIGLPWLWLSRGRATTRIQQYTFAVLSAIVFALVHLKYGVPWAIGIFAFQILAVYWYMTLQSLWPVIIAHFVIDMVWLWPRN